jgi:hypothetical protein
LIDDPVSLLSWLQLRPNSDDPCWGLSFSLRYILFLFLLAVCILFGVYHPAAARYTASYENFVLVAKHSWIGLKVSLSLYHMKS